MNLFDIGFILRGQSGLLLDVCLHNLNKFTDIINLGILMLHLPFHCFPISSGHKGSINLFSKCINQVHKGFTIDTV